MAENRQKVREKKNCVTVLFDRVSTSKHACRKIMCANLCFLLFCAHTNTKDELVTTCESFLLLKCSFGGPRRTAYNGKRGENFAVC